jgi:hypothetical protein
LLTGSVLLDVDSIPILGQSNRRAHLTLSEGLWCGSLA